MESVSDELALESDFAEFAKAPRREYTQHRLFLSTYERNHSFTIWFDTYEPYLWEMFQLIKVLKTNINFQQFSYFVYKTSSKFIPDTVLR